MGMLEYALGAGYRRFYDNLSRVAAQTGKKRLPMMIDAACCAVIYGSGLTDYLNYEFYRRSGRERRRYVTIRTQDRFYRKVSPPQFKTVFTVKPNFLRAFSAYTRRSFFDPAEGDVEALSRFLAENEVFMEKPIDGLGGHGVRKVSAAEVGDAAEYRRRLEENRLFVEQYIRQHESLAALCLRSVNTLRIVTSSADGTPNIVFAGLRVGNGNADVDNFHGGGMVVSVDPESGRLCGEGVDKALNRFRAHPVSGVVFDGYPLPYWEEVRRMVCDASRIEPRITVIGWDVALTPDGPVLVEGNRRPGFDIIQVACGRGRRDIVDRVLSDRKRRLKAEAGRRDGDADRK